MDSADKICDNEEINDQLLRLYNLITSETTIHYNSTNIII